MRPGLRQRSVHRSSAAQSCPRSRTRHARAKHRTFVASCAQGAPGLRAEGTMSSASESRSASRERAGRKCRALALSTFTTKHDSPQAASEEMPWPSEKHASWAANFAQTAWPAGRIRSTGFARCYAQSGIARLAQRSGHWPCAARLFIQVAPTSARDGQQRQSNSMPVLRAAAGEAL